MDILFSRFPNEKIEKLEGEFNEVSDLSSITGFVISSFDKKEKYVFNKKGLFNNKSYSFHLSTDIPFVISKEDYLYQAKQFIDTINLSNVDKAILSRIKKVEIKSSNLEAYFDNLCKEYPEAFVYLVSSDKFGTWLGASPEILLQLDSGVASTISLAGTKKESSIDWTNKEYEEQLYVTDYISGIISTNNIDDVEINGPYTYKAGPVYHLKTDFKFNLLNEDVLSLVNDLHPTPAIAGLPIAEALNLISNTEKHSRNMYSGFLGKVGGDKSVLYVNLRCCQIINNDAFLYLGGGFTKDSDANSEWAETENKSKTLLNIFTK